MSLSRSIGSVRAITGYLLDRRESARKSPSWRCRRDEGATSSPPTSSPPTSSPGPSWLRTSSLAPSLPMASLPAPSWRRSSWWCSSSWPSRRWARSSWLGPSLRSLASTPPWWAGASGTWRNGAASAVPLPLARPLPRPLARPLPRPLPLPPARPPALPPARPLPRPPALPPALCLVLRLFLRLVLRLDLSLVRLFLVVLVLVTVAIRATQGAAHQLQPRGRRIHRGCLGGIEELAGDLVLQLLQLGVLVEQLRPLRHQGLGVSGDPPACQQTAHGDCELELFGSAEQVSARHSDGDFGGSRHVLPSLPMPRGHVCVECLVGTYVDLPRRSGTPGRLGHASRQHPSPLPRAIGPPGRHAMRGGLAGTANSLPAHDNIPFCLTLRCGIGGVFIGWFLYTAFRGMAARGVRLGPLDGRHGLLIRGAASGARVLPSRRCPSRDMPEVAAPRGCGHLLCPRGAKAKGTLVRGAGWPEPS